MNSNRKKIRIEFSISEYKYNKFKEICGKRHIRPSSVLIKLIEDYCHEQDSIEIDPYYFNCDYSMADAIDDAEDSWLKD